MRSIFKLLYKLLCLAGRPIGGIRPRRLYDILARLAFVEPEFNWVRNRWGAELLLTHYYHLDRNILIFGCYDSALHETLEARIRPGLVCLDVGANLGEMALHMAHSGATVYAFEPVPDVFKRLKQHVERNGLSALVHVHDVALSDQTGVCRISVGTPEQDNQGLASIVSNSGGRLTDQIEIKTITLDAFVQREQIQRVDLIKVDIQGAEIKFLEGARQTLQKFAPELLMEIASEDLAAIGKNSRDLCLMLESLGYTIYELKNAKPGARIDAASIKPDFRASNVLCIKEKS